MKFTIIGSMGFGDFENTESKVNFVNIRIRILGFLANIE